MGYSDWPGLGGTPLPESLGEVRWAGHCDLHTEMSQSSGESPPRSNRCRRQEESSMPLGRMQQRIQITGQLLLSLFFAASAFASLCPAHSIHSVFLFAALSRGAVLMLSTGSGGVQRTLQLLYTKLPLEGSGFRWLALSYSGDPCPRVIDTPREKGHLDPVK